MSKNCRIKQTYDSRVKMMKWDSEQTDSLVRAFYLCQSVDEEVKIMEDFKKAFGISIGVFMYKAYGISIKPVSFDVARPRLTHGI